MADPMSADVESPIEFANRLQGSPWITAHTRLEIAAALEERDALIAARAAEQGHALEAFVMRVAERGGSIVCSATLTPEQITIANAGDRMFVLPRGIGLVYVPEAGESTR